MMSTALPSADLLEEAAPPGARRSRSSTLETMWRTKLLRFMALSLPDPLWLLALAPWRWVSNLCGVWSMDWYVLALTFIARHSSLDGRHPGRQNCLRRLKSLGQAPQQVHRQVKYRLPLWWNAASRSDPAILNVLLDLNMDMGLYLHEAQPPSSGMSFPYVALTTGNLAAFVWALELGCSPHLLGPQEKPLLCHALMRSPSVDCPYVEALLSRGADWYYTGTYGDSAFVYAQQYPSWSAWWTRRQLQAGLQDANLVHHKTARPRRL